jgi:hypothetical protein
MKIPTRVVALAVAASAAITAAVFAAAPQASMRESSVLTLKSNGKPIAVLTLNVLDDAPLEITSEAASFVGNEGRDGKATFSGGVTVRSRQAGERAAIEIKAEEIEMQIDKPKLR